MDKKNYKCVVSYRGTAYHGWQKQKNHISVQGMVEYALAKFFKEEINTTGASRTDAGVHAYGQVVNFKAVTRVEPAGIKNALNGILPPDIRIMELKEAGDKFNARRNVRKKFYRYLIYNRRFMWPVYNSLAWHVAERLDPDKMREILPLFKGKKNYFSFSASGSSALDHEREVTSITIKKSGPWIVIDYKGKSFLYNMLRRLTSALVLYAKGDISRNDIENLFKVPKRSALMNTAPPQGLYLVKIIYENAEFGMRNAE